MEMPFGVVVLVRTRKDALDGIWIPPTGSGIFIDRVAGEIILLVASVCVPVCVRLSVGALLFELFDL